MPRKNFSIPTTRNTECKYYIGIDPGKNGVVAHDDVGNVCLAPLMDEPLMITDGDTIPRYQRIIPAGEKAAHVYMVYPHFVILIEKQMYFSLHGGVYTNLTNFGALLSRVADDRLRYGGPVTIRLVTPQFWKKLVIPGYVGLAKEINRLKKSKQITAAEAKKRLKLISLEAAVKLYPGVKLTTHDEAEALLIMHAGKLLYP